MSDFQRILELSTFDRHDWSAIAACAVLLWSHDHAARRQKVTTGPRVGRGPGRVQQPAAELVALAVLPHHRVRRSLIWSSIRALAAWRERSAGPRMANTTTSRQAAAKNYGPLYAEIRGHGRSGARDESPGHANRAALVPEQLCAVPCLRRRGGRGFPNLTDRDWL